MQLSPSETRRLLQRKRIDENSLREAAQNAHLNRQRTVELGDVFVWKTPRFSLTPGQVKEMIEKVKKRKTLVLDLRGNGGGYVGHIPRARQKCFRPRDQGWRPEATQRTGRVEGGVEGQRRFRRQDLCTDRQWIGISF